MLLLDKNMSKLSKWSVLMYKIGYFSLALSVYNASFYNSEKVMSLCSIVISFVKTFEKQDLISLKYICI